MDVKLIQEYIRLHLLRNKAETTEERVRIDGLLEEYFGDWDEGDKVKLQGYLNEHILTAAKNVGSDATKIDEVDASTLERVQKEVAANGTIAGVKVLTGLAQVIDGSIRKGKIKEPKYPALRGKNPDLANRLSQAMRESRTGLPELRSYTEKTASDAQIKDNAQARAIGGSRGTALAQGNALRATDVLRKGELDRQQIVSQKNQRADNLLGASMREDANLFNDKINKFNQLYQQANANKQNLQNQINSGLNNMFKGVNQAATYFPYMQNQNAGLGQMAGQNTGSGTKIGEMLKQAFSNAQVSTYNGLGSVQSQQGILNNGNLGAWGAGSKLNSTVNWPLMRK